MGVNLVGGDGNGNGNGDEDDEKRSDLCNNYLQMVDFVADFRQLPAVL